MNGVYVYINVHIYIYKMDLIWMLVGMKWWFYWHGLKETSSFEEFILETCGFGRSRTCLFTCCLFAVPKWSKRQMLKKFMICVCNTVILDLWKFSLLSHLVKVHQAFFWRIFSALQSWFLKHFFGFKDRLKVTMTSPLLSLLAVLIKGHSGMFFFSCFLGKFSSMK